MSLLLLYPNYFIIYNMRHPVIYHPTMCRICSKYQINHISQFLRKSNYILCSIIYDNICKYYTYTNIMGAVKYLQQLYFLLHNTAHNMVKAYQVQLESIWLSKWKPIGFLRLSNDFTHSCDTISLYCVKITKCLKSQAPQSFLLSYASYGNT